LRFCGGLTPSKYLHTLSDFVWLCQLDEMKGMIVGQTYRPLSDFVWLCQLDEMNGMIVGQTYRPLSDFVYKI
jgi:hypothetical protein